MNVQGWSPLGLTGLISLQSKRLPRVFSSTIIWKCQFFGAQISLWSNSYICARRLALTRQSFVSKMMCLLFNMLSRFLTTFLPRSKSLNFMVAVIICSDFRAPRNKVCQCFHFSLLLFAMKWWDQMPWSSVFECWVLSQLFYSLLSLSSRGSLVLCFLL